MKRTFSRKQFSLHKDPAINEELGAIQHAHLTADNILDKLLRPNPSDKKQLNHNQKYRPQFEKRDCEALSKENMSLKQELKVERQSLAQYKFRVAEAERKMKFLEGIQQKWEQSVQQSHDGKRLQVYTQILKKKIQELNELYLSSEEKINQLKKLPHISIFDQQTIEVEHLQRQTVRLKAIIASMSNPEAPEDTLENKLLKLMKEENEKLKATIRLFENDKNLLKSRQTIQKRQIADFKKQIEDLKKKLTIREAELEKAQNQTKNILLKKAFQLKSDQEQRENEEIVRLRGLIDENRQQIQRLEVEKELLAAQSAKLKKNQKLLQSKQNNEDKQKSQLRAENSRLRRIIQEIRADLDREKENLRLLQQHSKKKRIQSAKPLVVHKIERLAPVKYQEIQLPILTIIHTLESGVVQSYGQIIPFEQQMRRGRLLELFCEQPLCLIRSEALKLARYLTESQNSQDGAFSEKQEVNVELSRTILKAAVNRMLECRSGQNEDLWRCLLAKSRRLIPELQKLKGEQLSKTLFLQLLGRHINQPFGPFVDMLILEAFERQQSEAEITVSVNKILDTLGKMATNAPLH